MNSLNRRLINIGFNFNTGKGYEMCEELKKRIKKSGLTQVYVAKKIKMKQSTFTSYINGYVPFPEDFEERVNEVLREEESG